MERFDLLKFASLIATLRDAQTELTIIRQTKKGTVDREYAKRIALESRAYCEGVGFKDSMYVCGGMIGRLSSPSPSLEAADIENILRGLQESIERELQRHAFVNVRPNNVEYFDQASLFGTKVAESFPKAAYDIREAGNCIALELNTAAVFHLMRTVEWGLRAFCRDLRLSRLKSVSKTGVVSFTPIEYADWNNMIGAVNAKIKARLATLRRGEQKQRLQEFYQPAVVDIEAIKDAYRNHVMHTRREYSGPEAIAICSRVKNFMSHIATRISDV